MAHANNNSLHHHHQQQQPHRTRSVWPVQIAFLRSIIGLLENMLSVVCYSKFPISFRYRDRTFALFSPSLSHCVRDCFVFTSVLRASAQIISLTYWANRKWMQFNWKLAVYMLQHYKHCVWSDRFAANTQYAIQAILPSYYWAPYTCTAHIFSLSAHRIHVISTNLLHTLCHVCSRPAARTLNSNESENNDQLFIEAFAIVQKLFRECVWHESFDFIISTGSLANGKYLMAALSAWHGIENGHNIPSGMGGRAQDTANRPNITQPKNKIAYIAQSHAVRRSVCADCATTEQTTTTKKEINGKMRCKFGI